MKRRSLVVIFGLAAAATVPMVSTNAGAATTEDEAVALCADLEDHFGTPNGEPLGPCQWDMALINAGPDAWEHATGAGVTVGVIDSGVDFNHPDIAPNLDVDMSCSFIFDDTETAHPDEIGNGDCSNKVAVQDRNGHGTHVASTIAAPINGIGIAGVAPAATIVGLKACTQVGYCWADSVAAALRYAGDMHLDVVNLSLFADPYLYYCRSDAEQRAIVREVQEAARYAAQQGVVIVASAGNETADLQHPIEDFTKPEGAEAVNNSCIVAPGELPETLTVSATGPVGYPGYDLWIADYSSVGMSRVNVTAPGGDYYQATGSFMDAILSAVPMDADEVEGIWPFYDYLEQIGYTGLTTMSGGAGYTYLNGTSMSSPHAAGVAALVAENHPRWGASAVRAAVMRSATPMTCPPDWEPLDEDDGRATCYGNGGRTSFFGAGMVNALAAAQL